MERWRWYGAGMPLAVLMNWPALVYSPPLRSHRRRSLAADRSWTLFLASRNWGEFFSKPARQSL